MEEKQNPKKKSKKIIIGVIILVIIIACIIAFLAVPEIQDQKQQEILLDEIEAVSQKTIGEDNFNTEIKTSGDYAKVESTIKNYLQKYSDAVKAVMNETENIQSSEGTTEKSELENKKAEIQEMQETVDVKIQTLIDMTSEDYIKNLIEKENLDQKYVDLYNQIMVEDVTTTLKDAQETMTTMKEKINQVFDLAVECYDYLIEHINSWETQNGQIMFYSEAELEEYNQLVENLQNKATELENM